MILKAGTHLIEQFLCLHYNGVVQLLHLLNSDALFDGGSMICWSIRCRHTWARVTHSLRFVKDGINRQGESSKGYNKRSDGPQNYGIFPPGSYHLTTSWLGRSVWELVRSRSTSCRSHNHIFPILLCNILHWYLLDFTHGSRNTLDSLIQKRQPNQFSDYYTVSTW